MKERFLEYLACPVDGAGQLELTPFELEERAAESDERDVLEGRLRCPECRRWFPVSSGIPSLFPDELRGGSEEDEFRERWKGRLEDADGETRAARDGLLANVAAEKKREIAKRDEESELYDELYPDELHTTERRNYDALFTVRGSDVLLDAGCGTGRLTKDYLTRCREIVGIDFSWESLRHFRERLTHSERAKLHLMQADICHLPLLGGCFDRLLCTGVLCFVPWQEQRRKALSEFRRILKPGGIGAINIYHYSWMKRIKAAVGLREANLREGYHSDGGCHYINMTRDEVRQTLSEWFTVEKIRGVFHRLPLISKLPRFSDRLDALIGRVGVLSPILANELTAVVSVPAITEK